MNPNAQMKFSRNSSVKLYCENIHYETLQRNPIILNMQFFKT